MPTWTGMWRFLVLLAVGGLGALASPSWGAEPDATTPLARAVLRRCLVMSISQESNLR